MLCDALAADTIPETPEDMARWIHGIARHKVVDYHRTAHRRGAVDAVEAWSPPPPVDARSVLAWLTRQVEGNNRDEESLDWLVRESAGERLDAVAQESGKSAANVRQRVCRLRCSLRKRWLAELAVAAVAVTCVLAVLRPWAPWTVDGLGPSASAEGAASSAVAAELAGEWRMVELQPSEDLDPARRSLARVAPHAITVRVQGNLLVVAGPVASARRTMTASPTGDRAYELSFEDGVGGTQQAHATVNDDGTLTITSRTGPWRGTVMLSR